MTVPRHIGVILDGNRRFAKRLMMKPWKGHEWGAKKFRDFTEWCFELGIKEITAYVFSVQNFNRPKEEFDYIMRVFKGEFEHLLQPEKQQELKEKGIRITFIGKQELLPQDIQDMQNELMEKTQMNTEKIITFALAYGGREEILEAVNHIAEKVKNGELEPGQINEQLFENELWIESQPDLIIRTGGDQRTSNFLPWQSTYSEWIYLEKCWPEITEDDLKACVSDFENRERRFGK